MNVRAVLCCVLCLSASKEGVTGPSPPLNTNFTLAPREGAEITSTKTTIRFRRVVSDSRCPADANCYRVGEAIVLITVKSPRSTRDYELRTIPREPAQHDGLTITLVDVSPYPVSTRTIAPDDYRATFRVARQ
jgi:hypothetical protein